MVQDLFLFEIQNLNPCYWQISGNQLDDTDNSSKLNRNNYFVWLLGLVRLAYFSPLKSKFHKLGFQKCYFCIPCFLKTGQKYKINSVYPSKHQIIHDASYTLFASFLASVIEIWLCHAWSMGWISYESDTNILKKTYSLGHSYSYGEHLIFILSIV